MADGKLSRYRSKRDFKKTAEPTGEIAVAPSQRRRFVIQEHDATRLHGSWVLVRMKHDRNGGKRNNWLLIKHRDEFARDSDADALQSDDRSVASGRTMT